MKASEIRAKIKAKKAEFTSVMEKTDKSQSVEEVKKLREQLETLKSDIAMLEELLFTADEDDVPDSDPDSDPEHEQRDNAQLVNGDVVRSAYSGNFSVKMENGGQTRTDIITSSADKLYLRSDEKLVSRVHSSSKKPLDMGKYIRGAVSGNWDNALEERAAFTTSTTGVIIPQVLSAQVIDIARNISLFASAGVPTVDMSGSNNLTIGRISKDPVFKFKEELAEAEDSNFELDDITLNAKTAYGLAYISLEALNSARNITPLINSVFAQAFADMIDKGMLYGQNGDAFAPEGIMNDPDIHHIVATNRWFDDFIKAIGQIKRKNGMPNTLGINAATDEMFALLKDSNGNALQPPKAFENLNQVLSNQLIEDPENGSDALVFDSNAMIIGLQNSIVIKMFTESDYCVKNGAVGFQIYSMLDCKATRPKHIAKITGVKTIEVDP